MADFGYDVADYEDVHPDFGDLATMDRLIAEAHKRGIRIILDFVPEPHLGPATRGSSSRAPRPTTRSATGTSGATPARRRAAEQLDRRLRRPAWEWDQNDAAVLPALFLKEQPDLNWRNPEVEQRMHDVLRFWMERGVDGFRIDVIDRIVKDPELRDNPPNPDRRWAAASRQTALQTHTQDQDWPDIIDYVRRIRTTVDEYPDRMTVGEVFGTPENIVRYYGGEALDGLHMASTSRSSASATAAGSAERVRRSSMTSRRRCPPARWPNWVLGNHDVDRVVSRVSAAARRARRAPALRGDAAADAARHALHLLRRRARHGERRRARGQAPGPRAPLRPRPRRRAHAHAVVARARLHRARRRTVAPLRRPRRQRRIQAADPSSMLNFYKRLLKLRRSSEALTHGDYAPVETQQGVFAYTRTHESDRLLIALNFTDQEQPFEPQSM